jgi:hypothetical protein
MQSVNSNFETKNMLKPPMLQPKPSYWKLAYQQSLYHMQAACSSAQSLRGRIEHLGLALIMAIPGLNVIYLIAHRHFVSLKPHIQFKEARAREFDQLEAPDQVANLPSFQMRKLV